MNPLLVAGTSVWQADSRDYATPEEAIAAVEAKGEGFVVRFRLERNLPHCLPAVVHRSSSMWCFQGGEWWRHYIYDGFGGRMIEEKPN